MKKKTLIKLEEKLWNLKIGEEIKIAEYTITAVEMTQKELESLPEFSGW